MDSTSRSTSSVHSDIWDRVTTSTSKRIKRIIPITETVFAYESDSSFDGINLNLLHIDKDTPTVNKPNDTLSDISIFSSHNSDSIIDYKIMAENPMHQLYIVDEGNAIPLGQGAQANEIRLASMDVQSLIPPPGFPICTWASRIKLTLANKNLSDQDLQTDVMKNKIVPILISRLPSYIGKALDGKNAQS